MANLDGLVFPNDALFEYKQEQEQEEDGEGDLLNTSFTSDSSIADVVEYRKEEVRKCSRKVGHGLLLIGVVLAMGVGYYLEVARQKLKIFLGGLD
jgi:hypothetical protein